MKQAEVFSLEKKHLKVDPKIHQRLKALAADQELSLTDLVEIALMSYLRSLSDQPSARRGCDG